MYLINVSFSIQSKQLPIVYVVVRMVVSPLFISLKRIEKDLEWFRRLGVIFLVKIISCQTAKHCHWIISSSTQNKNENIQTKMTENMKTLLRIIHWIGVKFGLLNAYSWVIEMKEEEEEEGDERKTNVDISLSFRLSWLLWRCSGI